MRPISDPLELLTAQHEEFDELFASVRQTADAKLFDELARKLVAHLALEQELLYPLVRHAISTDVLRELMLEHAAIKRVLGDLVWLGVEDPTFGDRLDSLTSLVAGHAGWQEEELFQTVAETTSPDALAALGQQFHQDQREQPAAAAA